MLRPLIFETDEQGYVIDERVKWFPVFKKLTQEEMTYVAWVTDYNSIYFNQPINLRRQRTSEKIQRERKIEVSENEDIISAVVFYTEIQYDSVAEQLQSQKNLLDVYTRGLNKITAMGTSAQDEQKIDKATSIQQKAEKEIDRLEKKLRERIIEDSKTRGDRVTNFYEVWRKENKVSDIAQKGIENYLTNV
jgi:hypothetical protein